MAHRTRLETLFEGDDTPVVHYNSNYKPRSLPSRPTNAKQFPSLANHYHTVHGHYNYPITTILEDPLPASTKYLDLPQQQLQQYHARGTTTSPTPSETTTPQQQKFSLAHFWNRHLFTAPPPPQQQILSASPSSSPPTPELYRATSAPPGVAPNNASSKIPTHPQQQPRHPQRSASSSSSLSYTLSPSSSSSSSSSSPNSSSSESRLGSASSTCVSDSSSTLSPISTTSSTSTSLSNLVLGTISKRSSRTGLSLPFTSSAKSPSLASAPVPLTTSSTTTGSLPSTASSGLKTVPLTRSQSHSAVMVKRNSQSSVSSSACPQHQQHQQGVMHGGRRGREDQEAQQQQPHEAEESTETAPQDEQDLQQPHILSIKKRVASGQVQLDHYRSMISQLEQQSSVFVQQQQELKERRDHVARAVESLENVLHRPWQTTTTTTSSTSKETTDHATLKTRSVLVDSSEQAKQSLVAKLGRRRSLPNNANHAGEVVRGGRGREAGREEGGGGQGQGQGGGGGGRGLFVFTQPSLWSSSSSHTPTKAVVLHSHDVGDAEKDDTDDMFVHPVVPDKRSSYPGPTSQATFSPSSPRNSADSNTSRNSRDDLLFKADCERCILKDELLHKRGALQQIQGEIERLQQRLNSCASQVRMIQRTFVGPIEQHLAMDQSELGRIERAIVKSA